MKLIAVIFPDNYYSQFYSRSCKLENCTSLDLLEGEASNPDPSRVVSLRNPVPCRSPEQTRPIREDLDLGSGCLISRPGYRQRSLPNSSSSVRPFEENKQFPKKCDLEKELRQVTLTASDL
jgi:hypothetical protein